jgi:hypothetical protein
MIGRVVTDPETGIPLDSNGQQVSPSQYQPPKEVMDLFARCQIDYGVAWQLQHRPFDEFDGASLLQRANLDQQTFGAFVGAEYVSAQRRWRWRGRKNTSRNKIIGILAQLMSAVLIPTVYASDEQDNDSKECARVMRILVEEHLRRSGYEMKFMFMVLSALVNPAVFVHVEYVQKLQTVKVRLASGEITIKEAVDDLMSGIMLNVVPIDELLLGDFFTYNLQEQPYLVRVRRISYDVARGIYGDKYFDTVNGEEKDRFDYVTAGKTRVFAATQENQTLYDIDWTEGDANMVQEAKFYYRGEDLEVTFVGGVFMGENDHANPDQIYNLNPFTHRRMTQVDESWGTMPVYPFAKSGAEPLDPGMRFAYYKSIAAKEYWDDATLNMMERLMVDGAHLDVMKPILISGIAKYDSNVIAPGAVASLPMGATVAPYQLSPNIAAAMNVISKQEGDLSDSTIAPLLQGQLGVRQSATAIAAAVANAKRMLTVMTVLTADLVRQVGDLTVDCIVLNETVGELNMEVQGTVGMKFMTYLVRGKDKGRDMTHKIVMTDRYTGRKISDAQKREREWKLWEEAGGGKSGGMKIWEVNPYQFARRKYTCDVDADEMLDISVGAKQQRKEKALMVLTSPAVAPFTDQAAVVDDFAIEEYGGNDPDRYKRKAGSADAMMQLMGGMKGPVGDQGGGTPAVGGAQNPGLVGLNA